MAKKKNTQRIKMDKLETEEQIELKHFVIILVIVVLIIVGIYFFTRIVVTKDLFNKEDNVSVRTNEGEINYNVTMIGSMLTRHESEYYVIMYNSEDPLANYYSSFVSTYNNNEKHLKVYTVDLNNELNKKYVTENDSEVSLTNLDTFKVHNLALIKVTNRKITKSYTDVDEIKDVLKKVD